MPRTYTDAVVTPHELATQAGLEVLASGGNAVDGAIAANAVLGVVAPETCGIGGDLFAMVWRTGLPTPLTLNASGWAGSAVSVEGVAGELPLDHPATVTIPGCVAGWKALADECGRMPLADVLEPAVRLATDGFPTSPALARALDRRSAQLAPQASGRELYPSGTAPRTGQLLRRRLLAATLTELADGGPTAFYEGAAGRAITEAVAGMITTSDLAAYSPDWVDPLSLDLFGRTAWTVPPNTQGYLTLAALGVFERLDPPADVTDVGYVHLLVEAYRALAAGRDALVADPHSAAAPDDLLGSDLLDAIATDVDRGRAKAWPQPGRRGGGTAYLCAIDRDGIGISLIQSNFHGIGSGIGAGAAGFFLHNRGAGFTLEPGHPNVLAPGKRPLHTLAPTLWTNAGELELLLGTRGGRQQPQLLAQVAAHLFHVGATPRAAQELPRWTIHQIAPGSPSELRVEERMPRAVTAGLEERGHAVATAGAYESGWGPVSLIHVDEAGLRTAEPDPRVPTATAAVR